MCTLELSVHGLLINIDAVVVDLNCQAILGMDILGDAAKLPFILDLVDYETIQHHRFHAATECFAETTDSVCIPPHSEVMLLVLGPEVVIGTIRGDRTLMVPCCSGT